MKLHAGAIVFFALALLFYLVAWLPGAWAFAVFGVICEAIAWYVVVFPADDDPPPRPPG